MGSKRMQNLQQLSIPFNFTYLLFNPPVQYKTSVLICTAYFQMHTILGTET
jgi:hypothetical protein